ncbi:MAG: class B sortase [Lachnospiraceae bacterium]|nr:class B sortase [Lachnospiraceae bacterium]
MSRLARLLCVGEKNSDMNSDKKKKAKTRRIITNILMVICAAVFVICAVYLIKYYAASKKSEDTYSSLRELIDTGEDMPVDLSSAVFEEETAEGGKADGKKDVAKYFTEVNGKKVYKKYAALYEKNPDFIGWLTLYDTVIDYPVMQTPGDEEKYLHLDFDGNYSSAGTPFADTDSSIEPASDNIIIYGHNMNTKKMFYELTNYDDEEFYKNHKTIIFDTIYGPGEYEVVAAFRTQAYPKETTGVFKYYEFFNAESKEDFDAYIESCRALTPYAMDSTAVYGDKLITLSTCAYHSETGRFVVVAKRIR